MSEFGWEFATLERLGHSMYNSSADLDLDTNSSDAEQQNLTTCAQNETPEAFPAVAKVAAAITFPLIFALGFFGNLLVIIVVFRNHKMQSTTHVLMVSLAFADLLFITFCVPTTLANYVAVESPFGDLIMSIADYVNYCTCYLSIYTLVLMSLDRFMAVVYATESRPYRTVRNTVMSIVALWPIIWLSQTFMFITEMEQSPEDCSAPEETTASTTKTLVFFLFGYLLPLCIIIVLYGAVIRRLFLTTNAGQSKRNLRSKRRAANLVVIVIACFAGSYLPVHILFLYQQFWMESDEVPIILVVQVCANIAAYMNSCINPILYAFLSRHFRGAFLQLFKDVSSFLCECEQSSSSGQRSRGRDTKCTNRKLSEVTTIATRVAEAEVESDSSADSIPADKECSHNNNNKSHMTAKLHVDASGRCQNQSAIKIELHANKAQAKEK